VADVLGRVRGPFNVNAAAMAAGIAAVGEAGWVQCAVEHNTLWRAKVTEALGAAGIKVWPSEGNFVLADFGTAEKAKAADAALKQRGLIVRAMGGYGLPQCLRITIGTAEECTMVIDALTAFMHG
jgi:histidinol-phosphate aminotransferase